MADDTMTFTGASRRPPEPPPRRDTGRPAAGYDADPNPVLAGDGVDLRGLVGILRRRFGTIIFATVAVLGLVLLLLAMLAPAFMASTQMLIDPRPRRVIDGEVVPTGIGNDAVLVESQVRLLGSDTVLRRVVVSENLTADPEFGAETGQGLGRDVRSLISTVLGGGARPEETRNDDPTARAVRLLRPKVSVRRAERTYVIEVQVSTRNAEKSARLANAIAQAYLADQRDATSEATRRANASLTARLDELQQQLRTADTRVEEYRQRNNIVGASGTLVNEQQLTDLTTQLAAARARVAEARSRADQAASLARSGAGEGALTDALNSTVIATLRGQLSEATRRESDLLNRLGPRHPSVSSVREEIAGIRRLLTEELRRIAQATRNELTVAQANERSIASQVEALKRTAQTTNAALVQLRELEREREAVRQIYENFLVRAKQTEEQERLDTPNARIIAPAVPPERASFPPSMLMLALGLVGGLGVGVGLALVREHFEAGFGSASRLAAVTGLDVLSVVPRVEGLGARRPSLRERLFGSARQTLDWPSEAIDRPTSPFARSIRRLRESLRLGKGQERILFLSADEGEGKTTIALNLALSAAAQGERVLLIDADFGNPALSRLIGDDHAVGLADVLDGRAMLADAVVRDDRTGLLVLPLSKDAQGVVKKPSRPALAQLAAATGVFDLVVVDGSPVRVDPGVRMLVDAVDGVVMVVKAGTTARESVLEASRTLRGGADRIVGAVLSGADPRTLGRYDLG